MTVTTDSEQVFCFAQLVILIDSTVGDRQGFFLSREGCELRGGQGDGCCSFWGFPAASGSRLGCSSSLL